MKKCFACMVHCTHTAQEIIEYHILNILFIHFYVAGNLKGPCYISIVYYWNSSHHWTDCIRTSSRPSTSKLQPSVQSIFCHSRTSHRFSAICSQLCRTGCLLYSVWLVLQFTRIYTGLCLYKFLARLKF